MTSTIAVKLDFVLKALSMSRGRLAAELGVDKSAVGRWVSGTTVPSAHNLSQLTALVAARVEDFTLLDWERDLEGLASALGVPPPGAPRPAPRTAHTSLSLPLLEDSLLTTRLRGGAYEGVYRSTRPYAQEPGLFIRDHVLIRRDANGFLRLRMETGGVQVEGWVMLMQNQLFFIGAELTSGAFVSAIFNGVSTIKAEVVDGLILYCALDPARTPIASAAIFERIGDLTDDPAADDANLTKMALRDTVINAEDVPQAVREHLLRNIGPDHLAEGGHLLLCAPLFQSLARGSRPIVAPH